MTHRLTDADYWSRIDGPDPLGCWTWTGPVDAEGYGRIFIYGHYHRAHRWTYEKLVAEIPEGLVLDHLCRNTSCVNPWHLEPVTVRVNSRRAPFAQNCRANSDRCRHGHPWNEANTYISPSGKWDCRACIRRRANKYRTRKQVSA